MTIINQLSVGLLSIIPSFFHPSTIHDAKNPTRRPFNLVVGVFAGVVCVQLCTAAGPGCRRYLSQKSVTKLEYLARTLL